MTDTAKKKPVNGKSKGNGFELTIAKLLSESFKPLQFKRTAGSGARVGGYNSKHVSDYSAATLSAFVSDIFIANEDDVAKAEGWRFRFCIECKFYKEADGFTTLFKNPQVKGWFAQALADSKKLPGKEAMLVFKFNHTPIFVAIEPHIALPNNITATMLLRYNSAGVEQAFLIAPLQELLAHQAWWKQPI